MVSHGEITQLRLEIAYLVDAIPALEINVTSRSPSDELYAAIYWLDLIGTDN